MIRPSFSGYRGIYPARSSPKLNSAHHSISTAQSSPVSPLVFASLSSFPGQQPPNLDVSHDLHLSDFPAYTGNMIFAFDPHARRSSNVSATLTDKADKRLGLDAQLSNEDRARTINSCPFTSGISTTNSINASIVATAPRPIPLNRIWSRLQHVVTKTFSKKSDLMGVEDPGGHERGSRASHRMSGPLPTTGASSVRDQDITRPSRRLSNPARLASGFCFHRP
jgi:hypothetical protein